MEHLKRYYKLKSDATCIRCTCDDDNNNVFDMGDWIECDINGNDLHTSTACYETMIPERDENSNRANYKFINEHGVVKYFPFDADIYKDAELVCWKRVCDFDISRKTTSALSEQVGGSHYKNFAIQPVEFIHKNGIGFIPGNIIKYVCRYENKNGIEDLKEARHYLDMLIEMEERK